jgi:hypothetical protein
VCDQETSNKEAKARYGAVENTTTMGCNAKKTNKQTNKQTNEQTIYIFKWNAAERNRCIMLENSSLSERCCPKKNKRGLCAHCLNIVFLLTRPVIMSKTKYLKMWAMRQISDRY